MMLKLSDIFGQDAAVAAIRKAYLADRLPHGLLFAGPVGVGKATTAKALGGVFLCEKPHNDEPCGKCQGCTLFQAGTHPDWHVITKELIRLHDKTGRSKGIELSISVMRPELVDAANMKSAMGRGKVFVVEQAELMNSAAQNAILKTLEEPAGRSLIVLLTDQPLSLLPTIRSRCQMVQFAALDSERIRRELEARGRDRADAADAAAFSEGSLGLALKWLEDGVIARARELSSKMEGLLAGKAIEGLPEWFKATAEEYAEKQLERDELASKEQATREALSLYLRLASLMLRRRLADSDDAGRLHRLCAAIDAIARADMFIEANVTVALIFQQLAVTLDGLFARPAGCAR